jgi:NAD(P)H-hydrate epimerase
LIVAGSPGFYGAAVLSATAAARVGAGYTHLVTHLKKFSNQKKPDFLTSEISEVGLEKLRFDAVAVGPGLGLGAQTEKIIKKLMKLKADRVVLDADALTVIAKKNIFPLPPSWILTPHEGELSRLLKIPVGKIRKNSVKYLQDAQKKYGCIVLLKGAETRVSNGKTVVEIGSGNPALAKSGTGDVLTGMIAGFLAQNINPLDAACLGAFIHGFAADEWVRAKNDPLGLLASDLVSLLPKAIYKLRKG